MIQHIIKLLWNKKMSNSLIMLEILLSFFVLFAVLSYVFFNFDLLSKPFGFETKQRLVVYFEDVPSKDSAEVAINFPMLKRNLLDLPEVANAAYGGFITPFSGSMWTGGYQTDKGVGVDYQMAFGDEDFAKTLGLKVEKGNWFEAGADGLDFKPVLVSRRFADEFYGGDAIIGEVLSEMEGGHKVTGIFEDYKYRGEFEAGRPIVFFYTNPSKRELATMVIHTKVPIDAGVEKKISDVIKSSYKGLVFTMHPIEKLREANAKATWVTIMALSVMSIFLCINIALGLFGVLWYNIQKRRAEIGLRMALGATTGSIQRQLVGEMVFISFFSILVGLFFAIQIPLLKVVDVASFIFYKGMIYAAIIVLVVVISCALFPSRYAAQLAPAEVLHED